jgi:hypothetical protein
MSSSSASLAAVILALLAGPALAVPCDIEVGEVPLFMCETDPPGHFLSICAVEVKPGEAWSEVQYRYSSDDEIEFVYPEEFSEGIARKLFFSHEQGPDGYTVSVRFVADGTRYRLTSTAKDKTDGHAELMVENTPRPSMTKIACGERPTIFPDHLRRALACDPENPFGAMGCAEAPPERK